MFAATARNVRRHCFNTLASLLRPKNVMPLGNGSQKLMTTRMTQPIVHGENNTCSSVTAHSHTSSWSRSMSTKGRSMRSKVERRMRKESGKTLREIRRAKKLRKKLMTDEERLIYNLKRAKKKVALLLQKLKKYELPELPPPRHDPELLTPEQLQAYKKIGFKNKNYVPVGVRGVFGGVVQNMHLHWKFHETVQVCCDNFPKEKIKEMATMLARLSGGVVVNIHNVKTIIMFRGRNYRQPKNLIPINTLTKRKALFKARFEQALESQKLNIKKIEQQLRRRGVNPEDPVAMASIHRVASTFFNAIDKKEGSPYVFHGNKEAAAVSIADVQQSEPPEDSDQEELDKFIAEIEDAADKEWAAEEAADQEEAGKIRYWNREEFGGRFKRSEYRGNEDYDDEVRGVRTQKNFHGKQIDRDSDDGSDDDWDSDDMGDLSNVENDDDGSNEEFERSRVERKKNDKLSKPNNFRKNISAKESDSEGLSSDLENVMWESDDGAAQDSRESEIRASRNYRSSSNEENLHLLKCSGKSGSSNFGSGKYGLDNDLDRSATFGTSKKQQEYNQRNAKSSKNINEDNSVSDSSLSDSELAMWESDPDECRTAEYEYKRNEEESCISDKGEKNGRNGKLKTPKQVDESWDSD